MKNFYYCVRDRYSGEVMRGCLKAADEYEAASNLKRQQYLIISLSRCSIAGIWKRWHRVLFSKTFDDKRLAVLCRQIAVMLNGGIGLDEALKMAMKSNANNVFKQFLQQSIDGLRQGRSLSEMWKNYGRSLPVCLISSLQAAEYAGTLAQCLYESSLYLQKRHKERRRLRRICIYPAFLLAVLAAVSCIMLVFVLPAFQAVFMRMDVKLPFITQFILNSSLWLKDNIFYILAVFLLLAAASFVVWQKDDCKIRFWRIFAKIPFWGDLWQKIQLAQIFYQLSFLLKSGIVLDQCLQIMIDGTHNSYFKHCLKQVYVNVQHGFSLSQSFMQAGLKDSIAFQLVSIGEFSGTLAQSLLYGYDFLTEEIDASIRDFMRLLEPMLMVLAGVVVGLFVISIVLPLFEMAGSISM